MVSGVVVPRGCLQFAGCRGGAGFRQLTGGVVVLSWEFPGRRGQLPLPLPEVAADDADVLCTVAPGDGPVVVAAYERAVRMAEQLWDALDRAGLGREVIAVVPTLTEDLRAVVRVQLTPAGARRAGWLFDGGTDPPSEVDKGGDGSWVA
jgi:hypothetical protein